MEYVNTKVEPKSFYITTLGCPKNIADSSHIETSLLKEGLKLANSADESHFHFINTCTFIQSANEETIETILESANIKKQNNNKLIVVGCFAERYGDVIRKELPEIDIYWGTKNYKDAGKLLKKYFPESFNGIQSIYQNNISKNPTGKPYSYIKISDGCNRDCHFCIIPKIRGKFRDISTKDILQDCQNATQAGAKEICLVSQDTVFYGKNNEKLYQLIESITAIKDIEILRFLYLYPDRKTYKLLDIFKENSKIAPYLESPLQHVSDKMLKAMNRTGNYGFYKELFWKAREISDLEIRTSFILGYPGETASDVDEILKFIEEVKPEKLALFPFSPQEGTLANDLKNTIAEEEIAHRVNLVREHHLESLKGIHQNRIGKTYRCIVDEVLDDVILARRFQDAPEIDEIVYIKNEDNLKVGDLGFARIESFSEYDMDGVWIGI